MKHFVVSARKYRPQSFRDVVGQKAITDTLLNAIENNHLAQALLFTGPRGVGKTTCARILAKKINEKTSGITDQDDFAFNVFELDAASNNSVDGIRNLIDQVRIPPQVGQYKVYIIDEVHMLSTAAFNAFLKTLEEPPKHAIFILATTEKHKIIPTILSRCQIFDFKRITINDIREYLKYIAQQQGIKAEDEALQIIAQKADGAMRDALSIFDRVVSFSGETITRKATSEILNVLDYETYFKITDLILENKLPELLIEFNEIIGQGFDGHHFILGLASHFRDLMVCKNPLTITLMEVGQETQKKYALQSQKANTAFLMEAIEIANDCELKYRTSRNQRLLVEIALMQLASLTFVGDKKKNDGRFIASPEMFLPQRTEATISTSDSSEKQDIKEQTTGVSSAESPRKQSFGNFTDLGSGTSISSFSLKSVQFRIDAKNNQKSEEIDSDTLPKEPFTQQDLLTAWKDYIEQVEKLGKKLQASSLRIQDPILKEKNVIFLDAPSQNIKSEILANEYNLMQFLKNRLKNHSIALEIVVNERDFRPKTAFTPQDKYNRLLETNPILEQFRKEFNLNI
ncbi:DNA polymerase III subunit gamma/tau [Capnocytophaga canimorsus]|nr:DNA polymerase III subunit gamma/tau [Capnocytophaga canimorsus]GIM59775.1 hypothetical protein CAPN007_19840 [Capnocytophaga canimorsus]